MRVHAFFHSDEFSILPAPPPHPSTYPLAVSLPRPVQERALEQEVGSLTTQRQRMARAAAKASLAVRQANDEIKIQVGVCVSEREWGWAHK